MSGVLNLLLAGAASAIKDAYFNLTTLLLNTSSTNGAQNNTFLDSSTNNFTITRNGNTTQGTFTPFSQTGWSNYFSGSSYLSAAANTAFDLGSSDFTIEAWAYFSSFAAANGNVVISKGAVSSVGADFYSLQASSAGAILFFFGSSAPVLTGSTLSANTWTHLAVTRSGTSFTLWVNGVSSNTATSSTTLSSGGPCIIGSQSYDPGAADRSIYGYISNARIVKGTAVYASAFTPQTTPLTNITNTSILTCQSNRFVDNSTNAFALTVGGGGSTSVQAFSPFLPAAAYDTAVVGGSGYFDGSGDYLNFTDSANDLDLGGLVASFEAWVYPTSAAATQHFAYKHGGAASWSASNGIEYAIAFDINKFYFVYNNGGSPAFITGATTRQPYQWHHVVVATDASNNMALFVNGVREGTATNAITKPTTRTTITIGVNVSGGEPIFGYVSGQRFIKGSGAYDPTQSTITVPTAPPTNITNTALLLNYTNAGIYDSASKNVLETVGNAQVSTTQAKWGTTSMYFDGTGDALNFRSNDILAFGTGDWTVEFWVYHASLTGQQSYVGDTPGNTNGPYIYKDTSHKIGLYYSAQILTATNAISATTWYHVAIARASGTVRLFINGTQEATAADSTNLSVPIQWVGADGTSGYFNGYIDDLRITKGYARYTANFTAPTAAFPLQ